MSLPRVFYEPVLLTADSEGLAYQAGAFALQSEAEKVLAIWRSEGRTEPMAINVVTLFDSAEEWMAER